LAYQAKGCIKAALAPKSSLRTGGAQMLHIVNGDSVGHKLKEGAVQGDILVWREIYTEGPVFLQPELPEHRAVRGLYLEEAIGVPCHEWLSSSEAQEKQLARFKQHEDVVLWFEHDLFDQTMLSFLLHWFAGQALDGTRLHLLSIGQYPGLDLFHGLGELSAQQLAGLAGTWREIGEEELSLGRRAWEAYTASTPEMIAKLLREDTSVLPFLHNALRLHLSRFPSAANGLGIVEQTTLELLLCGVDRPLDLFRQTGDRLHGLGIGDIQYWSCLKHLAQAAHPLLAIEGDGMFPGLHDSPESFMHRRVQLTSLGSQLANHKADWIHLNGINRWYGGVHLEGHDSIWRWDAENTAIIRKQV
jgi:hypothetical protein